MASLDAVETLAEGCRVVPGAGEVSGGECVRWMRDWLRELAESVTALAAAGGTVEQALDQVKLTRYNGWARHGELRESNVRIAFDWAKRRVALRQARGAAEAGEEKR
jgi:hypothetical protein